jgi:hypothetical protein
MAAVDSVRWALPELTILSALVVSLRLFCKKTRGIPVRQEDYTLVAAWVSEPRWRKLGSDEGSHLIIKQFFLLAACILAVVATTRGYGQHLADFRSDPTGAVRLVAPSVFLSVTAGALGKTSIAMTLFHILRERRQRLLVWFFVVSANTAIWGFGIFLWIIIWDERLVEICRAGGGIWGFAVFGASKYSIALLEETLTTMRLVWSAFTDFAFAALPWFFVIQDLARSRKDRIGLGVAMGFGILYVFLFFAEPAPEGNAANMYP